MTVIIQPELTWTGTRFERGMQITIDDGRIGAVGPATDAADPWPKRAVLPGLVNTHSHAFQRGLRGLGERFPRGGGSFWSWRDTMYELVESMEETTIYDLSRQAFTEMLAAGITTVGEFHYVHHDASGRGYAFDEVVVRAAADAGIRLVLLCTYYKTGGIGQDLAGGQSRFHTESPQEYWTNFDRLSSRTDPTLQSIGVAAHSIRAVPLEDLVALHDESTRREVVFHMHVEEQPAEIKACEAALGHRPMALLNERLAIDERFCAVHCTHTDPADMEPYLAAGGNVCICPLTEANLGDGIPDVAGILAGRGRICLGSDSNARIDFVEEMRWLEYAQRLSTESRGVCVDAAGHAAAVLLEAATANGARALGLHAGRLEAAASADLIAIDLDAPPLSGWTDDTLLDTLVFGAGGDAVAATCVAGRWVHGEGPGSRRSITT